MVVILFYQSRVIQTPAVLPTAKRARSSALCSEMKMCLHIFISKQRSEIYRAISPLFCKAKSAGVRCSERNKRKREAFSFVSKRKSPKGDISANPKAKRAPSSEEARFIEQYLPSFPRKHETFST